MEITVTEKCTMALSYLVETMLFGLARRTELSSLLIEALLGISVKKLNQ
jgi:hypothetical protein